SGIKEMKYIFFCMLLFKSCMGINSQSPADRITQLISEMDLLELNRIYPQVKEELPPMLDALSVALLDDAFGRHEEACLSLNNVLDKYQEELGFDNMANLVVLWWNNLAALNKYEEAAGLMQRVIVQLDAIGIPQQELQPFYIYYAYAEAMKGIPPVEVVRPGRESIVPVTIEVPASKVVRADGKLLFIPVTLRGHEVPFIFDTGCTTTFISERMASLLGVPIIADSVIMGGSGGYNLARIGLLDQLQVGEILIKNLPVTIPYATATDEIYRVDAVLGRDFMEAVGELQIYPGRQQVVFPLRETPVPAGGHNLMISKGQPFTEGYFNGERLLFHFDTGNTGVDLSPSFMQKHYGWLEQAGTKDTISIGGIGGIKKNIPVIVLADFPVRIDNHLVRLQNVTAFSRDFSFKHGKEDGSLGMELLRTMDKVTINLRKMFISLTPSATSGMDATTTSATD
ncbi:MAG: retroviral-like aspartic protease family protein, partial [Tannerellaceae bacterium]|nr:retroviral-like aspartic protease family protein [Tannerellaceae bacterium]